MNQNSAREKALFDAAVAMTSAAERVVAFGGHAHAGTRIDSPYGPMIFCTDPDGVRIELIQGGG